MSEPNLPPAPVVVANPEPIDVAVVQAPPDTDAISAAKHTAAAVKVDADVLRTADSRRISAIWERTQQVIALSVVEAALLVACFKSIQGTINGQSTAEAGVAFVFLASVANLVIGFYFGRTNHAKVGGEPTSRESEAGR